MAWSTAVLVGLCVAVFLVQAAFAGNLFEMPAPLLIRLGGNFPPAVLEGETWRLFSSLFLHGGILHIVFNMLALWQLGNFVERLYGRTLFVLLYVGSGLLASLASLWWNQRGVSVGASGAIFGVAGALIAWMLVRRGEMPLHLLKALRSSMLLFVGYSLIGGFVIPGIDNAAHIGGLLAGFVLGLGLAVSIHVAPLRAALRPAAWLAMAVVACSAALVWRDATQVRTEQRAQAVLFQDALSQLALEELNLQQRLQDIRARLLDRSLSSAEGASRLEAEVVSGWRGIQAQLSGFSLSGALEVQRQVMVKYVMLRAEGAEMLARWLRSGDQQWLMQAESRRQHAEKLLLEWQTAQRSAPAAR